MKESTLSKISWVLVFLIASAIFYISSLVFPVGPPGPPNYNSIAYHFFAFFWLTFFLLLALAKGRKEFIFIGIIISIVYGLSDEIHQLFVPGRCCVFSDFLINTSGILTATLIYSLANKEDA